MCRNVDMCWNVDMCRINVEMCRNVNMCWNVDMSRMLKCVEMLICVGMLICVELMLKCIEMLICVGMLICVEMLIRVEMNAYLRPMVSSRLYTTIIWQKKKAFREIVKYRQKNVYVKIAYNSLCVCVCVCGLYLCIVVRGRICDC